MPSSARLICLANGKTMRILIADDDPTSRDMLTAVLEKHGHEVVIAANGLEAWHAMRQPDAPRLAVLDWLMPEMDGVEVIRRLRAVETDCPPYIIMLTIRGESKNIITGLISGADDYIAKPCQVAELCARIDIGRRTVALQDKLSLKFRELQEPIAQTRILQGLLPICSFCKRIRDDRGSWQQMEDYIRGHSEAAFSHGVCPGCLKRHYPEVASEEGAGDQP